MKILIIKDAYIAGSHWAEGTLLECPSAAAEQAIKSGVAVDAASIKSGVAVDAASMETGKAPAPQVKQQQPKKSKIKDPEPDPYSANNDQIDY